MLQELAGIIPRCRNAVVLTGAGISAESGVPTFRGSQGLWGKFKPEELATIEAFTANPKIVWEWYNWRRELVARITPNPGHYAFVALAEHFTRFTLITQNVDGLHQSAGSSDVLELHGNISRNKCVLCPIPINIDYSVDPSHIPQCKCGGMIRPDVVWFGEFLPEHVVENAFEKASQSDIFFTIGTSALVHPAASLALVAKQHGAIIVEINPEETAISKLADFRFASKSGELLPELVALLAQEPSWT
ncbi:MAG: NAD-dependent deacylase [candidate division Zixibacteria bacterium]|nr:NAD-dependent deacylase [candidate division Zixibacteria bacterium]